MYDDTLSHKWDVVWVGTWNPGSYYAYLSVYVAADNDENATWYCTDIAWLAATTFLNHGIGRPPLGRNKMDPLRSLSLCITVALSLLATGIAFIPSRVFSKVFVAAILSDVIFCFVPTSASKPLRMGRLLRMTKSCASISFPQQLLSSMAPEPTTAHVFWGVIPCVLLWGPVFHLESAVKNMFLALTSESYIMSPLVRLNIFVMFSLKKGGKKENKESNACVLCRSKTSHSESCFILSLCKLWLFVILRANNNMFCFVLFVCLFCYFLFCLFVCLFVCFILFLFCFVCFFVFVFVVVVVVVFYSKGLHWK